MLAWKKDFLPMRYFQYGNAILPDGENGSGLLAITTTAVEKDDFATTLWRVAGTRVETCDVLFACYSARHPAL
jgi:hypothetical protein